MKKVFIWIGAILGILILTGVALFFFYPDEKLESFDGLVVDLPQIKDEENGFKYFEEASAVFKPDDDNLSQNFTEFLGNSRLEDLKNLYKGDLRSFLKKNSEVFKLLDSANEYDYLFSDAYLKYEEYDPASHLEIFLPKNELSLHKLLILRIIYKLEQGDIDGALGLALDLIRFDNKRLLGSASTVQSWIRQENLKSALSLLRIILSDADLNKEDYAKIYSGLRKIELNVIESEIESLKLEFSMDKKMVDFLMTKSDLEIDENSYHLQPNRTKNLLANYFRNLINVPFYNVEKDMLNLQKKYDSVFEFYLRPNSAGNILIISLMPSFGLGCKEASLNFDFYSLQLDAALKLYEWENGFQPAKLEDLVPEYFEDLDFIEFYGEKLINYDFDENQFYSDLLKIKCNKIRGI